MYLNGVGTTKIKYTLEQKGRLTAMGMPNWYCTTISHILKNSFYCGIITYHKEYTPDYLTQKKIKNYGAIEKTQVIGRHEPIVTVEEFERVQKIMESRSRKMPYLNSGPKGGKKPNSTIWGKLMICSCGNRFNRRTWNRKDGTSNVSYICYTTNNRGSLKTRQNKGLDVNLGCDVPQVQEWKLKMMAKYIFSTYIKDTDRVLLLAEEILKKHSTDKYDVVDYKDKIKRKRLEVEKLKKKADNYMEMRADGEISKEVYKAKSDEINNKISSLEAEILSMSDVEQKQKEYENDYVRRLENLNKILASWLNFENQPDISDNIIEAFIEKIVVTKDGFNWFLRCTPENHHCCVSGKKVKSAEVIESEPDPPCHLTESSTGSYRKQIIVFKQMIWGKPNL